MGIVRPGPLEGIAELAAQFVLLSVAPIHENRNRRLRANNSRFHRLVSPSSFPPRLEPGLFSALPSMFLKGPPLWDSSSPEPLPSRGELVQAQAELSLPSQTGGLRGPAAAGSAERAAQETRELRNARLYRLYSIVCPKPVGLPSLGLRPASEKKQSGPQMTGVTGNRKSSPQTNISTLSQKGKPPQIWMAESMQNGHWGCHQPSR